MDWNITYIISQIVTVIFYGLFAYSYLLKTQKSILVVGGVAVFLNAIAFILLGGWSGVATCVVALIANLVKYKWPKFGTSLPMLALTFSAIALLAAFTYDGFLSLMSVFATSLYRYSIWQKKPAVYKLCGLPVGTLWTIYNLYIGSIFGIILEIGLTVFAMVGFIKDWRAGKLNEEH
ncbi:MAG: YgjV family protein [Candidatus Nomurabacteria bacterium]|jgi:hypothetical protein|nr:YgjV family protein [Candidatus Nomurabacteria bacterium]